MIGLSTQRGQKHNQDDTSIQLSRDEKTWWRSSRRGPGHRVSDEHSRRLKDLKPSIYLKGRAALSRDGLLIIRKVFTMNQVHVCSGHWSGERAICDSSQQSTKTKHVALLHHLSNILLQKRVVVSVARAGRRLARSNTVSHSPQKKKTRQEKLTSCRCSRPTTGRQPTRGHRSRRRCWP